ncbi:hypothetical protein N9L91_04310 [Pseudomonadales bacterium]|nr:hypothetical protein [Pseudomonadales bacterium]
MSTKEVEKEMNNTESSAIIDKVIGVLAAIAGLAAVKFFGLLGLGAIAITWFVYEKTKEKLGRFIAACAGGVAGLAVYGLALITLFS